MGIISSIKSLLRRKGWQLVKLPEAQRQVEVSRAELTEVNILLKRFSEHTATPDLQDVESLKSYLSPQRIGLFHDLVEMVIQNGVDLDDKVIGDVGCGMGYLFRRIGQLAQPKAMMGYDTFEAILELSTMICPEAEYVDKSLFEVDQPHDIIFCMEVLEHMVDPGKAIEHLTGLCSERGALVLSVPNGRYDFQVAGQMRDDGQSYWGHVHFWSPESWILFLESHLPGGHQIKTGKIGRKHLFAIVQKAAY